MSLLSLFDCSDMILFMDKLQQLEDNTKKAIRLAISSVETDGDHHKAWTIDQILQTLAGEEYSNIVKKFEEENGVEWDYGVAP